MHDWIPRGQGAKPAKGRSQPPARRLSCPHARRPEPPLRSRHVALDRNNHHCGVRVLGRGRIRPIWAVLQDARSRRSAHHCAYAILSGVSTLGEVNVTVRPFSRVQFALRPMTASCGPCPIRQPFAELRRAGVKTAEVRTRPTRVIGERF